MRANRGNAVLKLLVALVVIAGVVVAVMFSLRETVIVEPVKLGLAVDAVPGSVEVHADKDLQPLKIEGVGRVIECAKLDPGTYFKKDDLLVQLDTTELKRVFEEQERKYKNEKAAAEIRAKYNTEVQVALRKWEEGKRYLEKGEVSKEDVNGLERAYNAARATQELTDLGLKKAEADFEAAKQDHEIALRKMRVVAPMDGLVEGALVAEGTFVSAGATVGTFYSNVRVVTAMISEDDIARVKLGDPVEVRLISYPDQKFEGKISKKLPFAQAETHRYQVWLDVKAELDQLKPNSTGEVTIKVGEHANVPIVPRRAICNGSFVYVVNGGRVEQRQIQTGFRALNRAEVGQGLKPGELVVVEELDRVRDGQRVRVETAK